MGRKKIEVAEHARADAVEYQEAVSRAFALTPYWQMRLVETVAAFVLAGEEPTSVTKLRDQRQAIDALRAAGKGLGLADGKIPTARQFDGLSNAERHGYTSKKVARLLGGWKIAAALASGSRPRLSAAQQALRGANVSHERRHEGYVSALRAWLATSPAKTRIVDYNNWRLEHNQVTIHKPVPKATAVMLGLGLSWRTCVALGRGEIAAHGIKAREVKRREQRSGPHDLVSTGWLAHRLGVDYRRASRLAHEPGFPPPALEFGVRRAWRRCDLEAYIRGEEVPTRVRNELRPLYYDRDQVAKRLGLAVSSVSCFRVKDHRVPEPAGMVTGHYYWLVSDVEEWIVKEKKRPGARSRASGFRTW